MQQEEASTYPHDVLSSQLCFGRPLLHFVHGSDEDTRSGLAGITARVIIDLRTCGKGNEGNRGATSIGFTEF